MNDNGTGAIREAVVTAWRERLGFARCLAQCVNTPEFVAQYDRLRGTNLSGRGTPLERAIDRAAGRMDLEFPEFVEFVREFVWNRLPADARADLSEAPAPRTESEQ